jgi:hypothetical protein
MAERKFSRENSSMQQMFADFGQWRTRLSKVSWSRFGLTSLLSQPTWMHTRLVAGNQNRRKKVNNKVTNDKEHPPYPAALQIEVDRSGSKTTDPPQAA